MGQLQKNVTASVLQDTILQTVGREMLKKRFRACFNPRYRSDVLPMFGRPHWSSYKLIYFGLMCLLAVCVGGLSLGSRWKVHSVDSHPHLHSQISCSSPLAGSPLPQTPRVSHTRKHSAGSDKVDTCHCYEVLCEVRQTLRHSVH